MADRPMLGEVELPLVQRLAIERDELLAQHSIPALEGDFFQDESRRSTRVRLDGIFTGDTAGESVDKLRQAFRDGEPVSFTADITTATTLDKVMIERLTVRQLAGKSDRYDYAVELVEYVDPPKPATTQTGAPTAAPDETNDAPVEESTTADAASSNEEMERQVQAGMGTVEVTVELADQSVDLSQVKVQLQGKTDAGEDLTLVIEDPADGVFRKTDVPPGGYTASLVLPEA
jgi:hypothetical protein